MILELTEIEIRKLAQAIKYLPTEWKEDWDAKMELHAKLLSSLEPKESES